MKNCWEYKNCERQPSGAKSEEFGECPASTYTTYDGVNEGENSGRYCWRVAGTLCGGEVQGSSAQKMDNCNQCDFYKLVKEEEGDSFIT